MLMKSTRIAAVVLLLSGLLGIVAASALPPDIPPALRDALQNVVSRVALGLRLGLYSFDTKPIELGKGIKAFVTLQQSTPPNALTNLEKGFPIARFSSDVDIQLTSSIIPAGNYYLVLWIADLPFERFEVQFLPRTPLLLFVKVQSFELVDFDITCKVEVEVPNKNPDKTFPFMMSAAKPEDCAAPSASAASAEAVASNLAGPGKMDVRPDAWGLGTIIFAPCIIYKCIVRPDKLVIPTKEQLFPPKEKGPPPPPPPPSG